MDTTKVDIEKMQLAANIMSGLLASGHYTQIMCGDDGIEEPTVRVWDADVDWKDHGHPKRFPSLVVEDTMSLLQELEFRIITEKDS